MRPEMPKVWRFMASVRPCSGLRIQRDALAASDPALVEDLVLAAMRDALGRAEKQREERMARVTGGLSLTGIF